MNTGAMVNLTGQHPVSVAVTTVVTGQSSFPSGLVSTCMGVTTPSLVIIPSPLNVSVGPPPLLRIHSTETNVNPFYIKPLGGNIRVCQGCRSSLRLSDGSITAALFDFVVARMEKRSYRDATGALKTPGRPSGLYSCYGANFCVYVPQDSN